jgi:hypothetical protein
MEVLNATDFDHCVVIHYEKNTGTFTASSIVEDSTLAPDANIVWFRVLADEKINQTLGETYTESKLESLFNLKYTGDIFSEHGATHNVAERIKFIMRECNYETVVCKSLKGDVMNKTKVYVKNDNSNFNKTCIFQGSKL